jgi:hypothetical protein
MTGNGDMRGPDFLVIGAQRSGTTWIHRLLQRHPALWLTPVKEIHYFDRTKITRSLLNPHERRRVRPKVIDSWHLRYLLGKRNDHWYRMLFRKAHASQLIAGEVTPAYSTLDEEGLRRIHAMNSEVKIIYVMRDPVERDWSAVNNLLRKNMWDGPLTIDSALRGAQSSIIRRHSAYTKTIALLEVVFPSHQLYFCFFDDLRERPRTFAANMLSFLEVDPDSLAEQTLPGAVNIAAGANSVPVEFAAEKGNEYLPMIRLLCERFEGPPAKWRLRYEQLLADRNPQGVN